MYFARPLSQFFEDQLYSRLPITRTLANSNLALTRTKIGFPSISFIYLQVNAPLTKKT